MKNFVSQMMGSLAFVLMIAVLIGMIAAPVLIRLFAPGFDHHGGRFVLAYGMLRVTFPYLLFISMVAMSAAILNTYGMFGVPAFAPVLLNVCLIASAVWISPHFAVPVKALAWGVCVAGLVQLLFLLPFLAKKNLLPKPSWGFADPGVRRVLKLMGPAIFGVSVAQVNLLLDTVFASFLKVGSVSWLYYSERLMMFPLGVFGVAISTVILPSLSKHVADKDMKRYASTLDWALRLLLLVGVPAALGLFVLSGPMLTALFQYKAFTQYDVLMSRESLMAFSIGLPAFMMTKVLAAGFYSQKDIKTPVKIAVVAMLSNIVLNILLLVPLHHAGIALSTSLSSVLNSALLWIGLHRRKIFRANQSAWINYLMKLLVANVVMVLGLSVMARHLSVWFSHGAFWRLSHLFLLIIAGICLYLFSLFLLKLRPREFLQSRP
ncbi:MAG: murein biosynthesis integral membrane protein MurJ [Legionellaceae bacterium]|nr:murein biosynthesis integral membrane protein MurJ [Legionellaceae bacterium]